MNLTLEILFVLLALADVIITYAVLESGKGVEVGAGKYSPMPSLIKHPAAALTVTLLGVAIILVLVNLSGAFVLLWPVNAVFTWACLHNWTVLRG